MRVLGLGLLFMSMVAGLGVFSVIITHRESQSYKQVEAAKGQVRGLEEELNRERVQNTVRYNSLFEDYKTLVMTEAQRQLKQEGEKCVEGQFFKQVADGTVFVQVVQQCGVWKIKPVGEMRKIGVGERP